jgi:hypothetical protein
LSNRNQKLSNKNETNNDIVKHRKVKIDQGRLCLYILVNHRLNKQLV